MVGDLRQVLPGRRIESVWVGHPQVFRHPPAGVVAAILPGRRVAAVRRRGKYIVMELEGGDDLVVHLGMTGHLLVTDPQDPVAKHTHLRAPLDNGSELRFDDARRFGRILVGGAERLERAGAIPRLGVEPLSADFTREALDVYLRRTTRPLKSALLDQRGVAGLGNIYIDEACHRAGVRPQRRSHTLTRAQRGALFEAIPAVLRAAVANRGSSVDDYRDVWNAKGSNQDCLQVYGRGGRPCQRCGATLRSLVVGGRTTVYCPACQR
ncbi:MAG: bifunctional DNA-formamidopyrimidine glycosylase/DNA-(apurinic or apyrimidinic site) lyase [Candidatus Dormibacteria bacterium]